MDKDYIDDLEAMILDIIKPDWTSEDIMYFCDLSLERSVEIYELYQEMNKNYNKRHGIDDEN